MAFIKHKEFKFAAFLILFLVSCSGEEEDRNPSNALSTGSWSLGSYVYSRGTSIQSSNKPISNGPDLRTIVISTTGIGNYGRFSGSSITGYFFEQGEGDYKIVDEAFLLRNGHTGKFIALNCNVGIGTNTGSTVYSTSNSEEFIRIGRKDNNYTLSTKEDLILTKSLDVNGGVQGALSSYIFKANQIF